MEGQVKIQQWGQMIKTKKIAKKERTGRWTPAECDHFQILLQRYGKNWIKIHQSFKSRTASQIRSHAQKYFEKIGHKKVLEYQRRAKLIEAYEILENEKRLQLQLAQAKSPTLAVAKEEESNNQQAISQNLIENSSTGMAESISKLSETIKEQQQSNLIKQSTHQKLSEKIYPFASQNTSFLMYLIQQNPAAFVASNFGIEALVDEPGFRSLTFSYL